MAASKASNPPKGGAKKSTKMQKAHQKYAHLFVSKPKEYGVGRDSVPKRDLTRFVRWPKYVQLQRQRRILMKRMSVPPQINQFTRVADKPFAHQVVTFLKKYKPETRSEKKEQKQKKAQEQVDTGAQPTPKKSTGLRYGVNEVVKSVESKRAQLVVIPHDVDPIELVVYLPALCVKLNVPYVIVKSRSRLGEIVDTKKVAALAIESIKKEDRAEFQKIVETARQSFNDQFTQIRRQWGGGKLSKRSTVALEKRTGA